MSTKILLIEDDAVLRENTSEILELAGFEVEIASNGKEGVKRVKTFLPDLIICDIMMPELDGFGVLYLLSRNPETAGIPFIFLTAKTERDDIRKGMELGADDYLTKPFEDNELLNAIEVRLKKRETINIDFNPDLEGLENFIAKAKNIDEFKDLNIKKEIRKYKKGDAIYYEGNQPTDLFLIIKGKVKTFKMNNDNKELIIDLYKEGDFFGYIPILENSEYNDNGTALENTEICKIPTKDFLELTYKNRDVANKFIKLLSNNLVEKEKRLLHLAYDSVRMKTAHALLELYSRFNIENDEERKLKINRDDLASIAGIAKESLIRALAEFKEEKLIDVKDRDIILLNIEQLKNLRW